MTVNKVAAKVRIEYAMVQEVMRSSGYRKRLAHSVPSLNGMLSKAATSRKADSSL
jgi:hypothetical protein